MGKRPTIITVAEKKVEAVEDWYPCFENHTVRVKLTEYVEPVDAARRATRPAFRLSVWGADDTGMERDARCDPKERDELRATLLAEWDQIPSPLSRSWLKEHGFVNA